MQLKLGLFEQRSEVPVKILNVVLEKDGEDQLVQSCKMKEINVLHTIKRRNANWIGHILHRNCLLKHVTAAKMEGWLEVTGRQKTICEQLLNNLKEMTGYQKMEKEPLHCTPRETHFRRGHGPIVRQATE